MKADKLILSEAIWTGLGNETISGGIAIKQNKILYIGSESLDEYKSEQTEILDYKDHLVIPGIHDSHLHFFMSSVLNSGKVVLLYETKSEEECIELLKKEAEKITNKEQWIMGFGWYNLLWDNQELPSKASLDEAFPDQPMFVQSSDAHTVWMNSAGFKKLNITKDTPDPVGGHYSRDEQGELTGILHETAGMSAVAQVYKFSEDESSEMIKTFIKHINSLGITAVSDLSMMAVPGGDLIPDHVYHKLLKQQELNVRIHMYPTLVKDMTRPDTMRKNYQFSKLQTCGVKQFFDGVSSTHTAFLSEPYSNAKSKDDVGTLTISKEEMRDLVLQAIENDYSVRIHTIGDGAISMALDIFEEAEKKFGKNPHLQHCLEHLENIQEKDIQRLKDLNILASCQPAHSMIDPEGIEADLGQDRIRLMWPFRDYLSKGVKLSFGTDSPVSDINPFESIYNAVVRKRIDGTPETGWQPQQSISVQEALRAYTWGSYQTCQRTEELGTLEIGKLADLAILDTNIFTERPEKMIRTTSLLTMIDGDIVYKK
ncbi:amidohydrolase [Enterococcus phoeniculicola]|jgi:predicted amidohydrolase YtcJ|uniref:Amidohydrolase 3 domain-containing protein n=1 Tax=Enterococcus phoeniculicola ATCC BAA-412 TaxID=1158610 RepID=R3WIW5_9ENTE|nr:amidohydrolase [Enterococcus phoeniculicola]EOL41830.1 hypothetical protein UC3_03395 [Enterococcus phoeniculicola ATCC BAA-412]EOT78676.1 hypothetical protein I589_00181 [Enterococcus phoeniculicola ATCC BAA-412]